MCTACSAGDARLRCGGPSANSLYELPTDARELLGCARMGALPKPTDGQVQLVKKDGAMTPELCGTLAKSQGLNYYATQVPAPALLAWARSWMRRGRERCSARRCSQPAAAWVCCTRPTPAACAGAPPHAQASDECYGFVYYGNFSVPKTTGCTSPCAGDQRRACGGTSGVVLLYVVIQPPKGGEPQHSLLQMLTRCAVS